VAANAGWDGQCVLNVSFLLLRLEGCRRVIGDCSDLCALASLGGLMTSI
jgi:hypothetical protein